MKEDEYDSIVYAHIKALDMRVRKGDANMAKVEIEFSTIEDIEISSYTQFMDINLKDKNGVFAMLGFYNKDIKLLHERLGEALKARAQEKKIV